MVLNFNLFFVIFIASNENNLRLLIAKDYPVKEAFTDCPIN